MKRYGVSIFLFIVMVVYPVLSCATDRAPLANREPRISSLGFSFIPPPGANWVEEFGENEIKYIKQIDPAISTLFGGATELQTQLTFATPEKFREYITAKRKPTESVPRFTNTKASYSLEPSIAPFCVRYKEQFEDRGAKNRYGRPFLVVFNHGIICLHPENPKVSVDIYYSYRYPPDKIDKGIMSEGEEFINSLKMLIHKKQ